MAYILLDTKNNVRIFQTDAELENFLTNNEGIYYLIKKEWKHFIVSEIYSREGKYSKITERYVDVED